MALNKINLSFITDHLGAILVAGIIGVGSMGLKTWLTSSMNAESMKLMREDHDAGAVDRYTGEMARERDKHVDARFAEAFDRLATMEGRHQGH